MPAEILLVVNVLPENDPKAQAAIQVLKHSSADVQVLHAYEQNFRPCVGAATLAGICVCLIFRADQHVWDINAGFSKKE